MKHQPFLVFSLIMAVSLLGITGIPSPASVAQPLSPDTTVTVHVNLASDDAGIIPLYGGCDYALGAPEIYFGECANGQGVTSGFRFANVPLPARARVTEAHITFTVDGPGTDDLLLRFYGEDSGNAETFSRWDWPGNRLLIPNVTADWHIPFSDVWQSGNLRSSPSLAGIIQAIVNRDDWTSGNALAIVAKYAGTFTNTSRYRRIYAYERTGISYSPVLVVSYSGVNPPSPTPPSTPTRTATATSTATATASPTATATETPTPDRFGTMLVMRANPLPIMDGNVGEWNARPPDWLNKDTAASIVKEVPNLTDFNVGLRTAWITDTLYISAAIVDDVLIGNESANPWQDDTLEVGIQIGGHVRQFAFSVDGRRRELIDGNTYITPTVTFITSTVPGGWQFEVAIPKAELGVSGLAVDQRFPFTYGYQDDDNGGPGDSHLIRWGTSTNSNPEEWARLILNAQDYPFPTGVINALRASRVPVIDGDLSEWAGIGATYFDKYNASASTGSVPAPAPSDLSAKLRMAWAADMLYLAAYITDDVLIGNDSVNPWNDDYFMTGIYVSASNLTHQFCVVVDGRKTDQGVPVSSFLAVSRTVSGGWSFEAAIPIAALGSGALTANQQYPFTFGYVDDDIGGGGGQTNMLWQGTQSNAVQSTWGTLWLREWSYDFPFQPPTSTPTPTPTATATRTPDALRDKLLVSLGVQPSIDQFNDPAGIAIDASGNVYVADTGNHRIQRFTKLGAPLGAWGALGSAEGQFSGPAGIAIGANGAVYVADTRNHRIQFFDGSGQFSGAWGSYGAGNGQFNTPAGIAVAADGSIYVADSGNHRIQHFTATGSYLSAWGSEGLADDQFRRPSAISIATDGTVYVADTDNDRIQRFTATGGFLGQWGASGNKNGQFNKPRGLTLRADNSVCVADSGNHRIQCFTAAGDYLDQWGSLGTAAGQLNRPSGLAVAPDATLYVVETGNHRIQQFTADGGALLRWGSRGQVAGQFAGNNGVAFAPDGTVYVADTKNHRIQRFSANGEYISGWGTYGQADGQFDSPSQVAVAPDGTIYVADYKNHRIQRFTGAGVFLSRWGTQGQADGQFIQPGSVSIGADGSVYVADTGNHRVQRFTANGQFLGKWGSYGHATEQFDSPWGIDVTSEGKVYVADTWNYRVQQFTATGAFVNAWGKGGSGVGQFNGPWSVVMAADGTVYVADTFNYRIQRFTGSGGFLGAVGSRGAGDAQFEGPGAVDMSPNDKLGVADPSNNRVQIFGASYPSTWRGEYFANRWLAERPVLIRDDAQIDYNWGNGSPGQGVPANDFSVRWQRYVWFEAGTYAFIVDVDDGLRLWVDDRLLLDEWNDNQHTTFQAGVTLSQGYHRVRLEYFDASGPATVRLSWAPFGPDAFEADDTCAQAKSIVFNSSVQLHNFHTAQDADWVKFDVSTGFSYMLETSYLGRNADTVLELYKADCTTLIAQDNDGGDGLGSRLLWDGSATETLYAKVRPLLGSNTGPDSNYNLSISRVAVTLPSPTPTMTATPTPSPTGTPTVTPEATPKYGSIAGTAWFDRDGNSLQDNDEPGLVGIVIKLFLTGVQVGTKTTLDDGSFSFTSLVPGTYQLREVHPEWFRYSSTPDEVTVTVTNGQAASASFGDWNGVPIWIPLILR